MANLNTKLLSIQDDNNESVSSILLRDEDFEITTSGYKGGKPTNVSYADVKSISVGRDNIITLKIKRTEICIGPFDKEVLDAITIAISVGQSGDAVSCSKAWKKYLNKCDKAEKSAERIRKISDTISGIKAGVSNALSDSDVEDSESDTHEEKRDWDEEAKERRTAKLHDQLESFRINLSDPIEESKQKLTGLGNICHKIIFENGDYSYDIASEALSIFEEGIDIVSSQGSKLPEVELAQARFAKLKARDKKNKSNLEVIICGIIFVIICIAWYWFEKHPLW